MKKTFKWFDDHAIEYEFIDYKKTAVDDTVLSMAMDQHGWDSVINKRGTTWRTIDEDAKNNMTRQDAELLAHQKPSIIKRPLIVNGNQIILGFNADKYDSIFIS